MARHIETKKGLKELLERMKKLRKDSDDELSNFDYWFSVVYGCIDEDLAMDEIDYENAPDWFRPLWRGLK